MVCLKLKLAGTQIDIASWGHEYVRYLSVEIAEEYNKRILNEAELDNLDKNTLFLVAHNYFKATKNFLNQKGFFNIEENY